MTASEPASHLEFLAAIIAAPEDDDLRLRFAAWTRPYDEPLAEFVELQVARAQRRRAERGYVATGQQEKALLRRHEPVWSHTFSKYTRQVEFDRGFIAKILVDPYLFLEYGEWLFKNAPVQHVSFVMPEEGTFPLGELLASGLLTRVTSMGLSSLRLTDEDIGRLAGDTQLERCLCLRLSDNPLGIAGFQALAAGPATRGLVYIERISGRKHNYFPGEVLVPTENVDRWGAPVWDYAPVTPEGQQLESRYGYIPWLHHENWCDPFDARWYVDNGVLPVKPVGTSVQE